ncbi:MAG: TIGR04282 family arsenosugar biosynthesis glycosyltransferase [Gammaproteobacteria bacterium]|nr:TIGR04282 family arsenosugar biosynthesis glycosyltransferase [Gammaproteobacteria bacterium]
MSKIANKLIIFTRSPVLGEVKTRLQPTYTPEQSLILHKKLVLNTLMLSQEVSDCEFDLHCSPNRNSLFFLECENNFPVSLIDQQGDDLGQRMAFAFSVALQAYNKVVIIGTDCPGINEQYIHQAFAALDNFDAVIGPAADGGYVLLGLKKFSPEIFLDISWGQNKVLTQTKKVLKKLAWSCQELAIMHDIDRPQDLQQYPEFLNEINKGNTQ